MVFPEAAKKSERKCAVGLECETVICLVKEIYQKGQFGCIIFFFY